MRNELIPNKGKGQRQSECTAVFCYLHVRLYKSPSHTETERYKKGRKEPKFANPGYPPAVGGYLQPATKHRPHRQVSSYTLRPSSVLVFTFSGTGRGGGTKEN